MFSNSQSSSFAASSTSIRPRRLSEIYSPRQPPTTTNSSLANVTSRLDLVRQHGDFTLAYTTAVQSRLKYFGDDLGYIAYDRRMGCTFVLGDPVTSSQRRELLVRQFVAQHRRPTFCQISAATAEILQRLGYYVNEMGVDTVLNLREYDFQGQHKRWLRYAAAWTDRHGFVTREQTMSEVDTAEVERVSLAWRATRLVKSKEARFLNRPMVMTDEPATRRFFFYDADGRLLAFVFFDPIHRAGKLIGYVPCTKRRHPDAPVYAEHTIMKHAIEVFQSEGCQELRLGLSPLAWIEDQDYRAHWLVKSMFRSGFASKWVNKYFYNVQGHALYKRKFRGQEEKVYFASCSGIVPWRMVALIKLCKIV